MLDAGLSLLVTGMDLLEALPERGKAATMTPEDVLSPLSGGQSRYTARTAPARTCNACGASLEGRRSDAKTCSARCRVALVRRRHVEPETPAWTADAETPTPVDHDGPIEPPDWAWRNDAI